MRSGIWCIAWVLAYGQLLSRLTSLSRSLLFHHIAAHTCVLFPAFPRLLLGIGPNGWSLWKLCPSKNRFTSIFNRYVVCDVENSLILWCSLGVSVTYKPHVYRSTAGISVQQRSSKPKGYLHYHLIYGNGSVWNSHAHLTGGDWS